MISRRQGVTLVAKGDAFLLAECQTILIPVQDLTLNRTIGEICYKHFPILNGNRSMGFLRLPDHKLVKSSPKRTCSRTDMIFINDVENKTYLITVNATLREVNVSLIDDELESNIEDIFGYAEELVEHNDELLDQPTLLELISETSAPLEQLQELHDIGHGDIHVGVAEIFGAVFEAAGQAGGYLMKAFSSVVTKVVTSLSSGASKLVKSTAEGGATLITSAGSSIEQVEEGLASILSSFLPWVNSAIILAILGYLYWVKRDIPRLTLPNSATLSLSRPIEEIVGVAV
jgi:hypothetical protein